MAASSQPPAATPATRECFVVTADPLDPMVTARTVMGPGHGAVAMFIGIVRDHNAGRSVQYLDYECYEPLTVKAFERIASEAREQWPTVRVAVAHRVGPLQVGEASVVIAAGSAHRGEAFSACRYAIERLKQIAPIWKREYFDGGDVWVEGAAADPDNAEARREALTRAGA